MRSVETSLNYRKLPAFFYQDVDGSDFENLEAVAINTPLAKRLGLSQDWLGSDEGRGVLSGQSTLSGDKALAMTYGGHQFGHWAGLLGDGRARLVGDIADKNGQYHELHLKGAGKTPFSRRGDGKKTLGSAIREYIVSEAMAALAVPTTRSLSILTTGENIVRHGLEPGAVLCRTARSHIRVGTFQIAAASGEVDNLKALADFAIERLYSQAPSEGPERYSYFLKTVIAAQASLIAKWMSFGFIHGVMNTDNACVSGETIDYGPCAFMDVFHPAKTFSSIDRHGRYAWNRQPDIALWNMARLAESLLPLLGDTDTDQLANAQSALDSYTGIFETEFNKVMAKKLGLSDISSNSADFIAKTFEAMTVGDVDFTLFFRNLTLVAKGEDAAKLTALFKDKSHGAAWLKNWRKEAEAREGLSEARLVTMASVNPIIIPRNHRIEEAIQAANIGDYKIFETLLKAVRKPFEDRLTYRRFETPPKLEEIVHETFCGT